MSTEEELLHILKSSRDGDLAEFWLGETGLFPALVVHTNRELAYLHYFLENGHPGFQPVGNHKFSGQVKFLNEISVSRAVVVGVEQAYQAAVEFFNCQSLPDCIEWCEL